MIPTNPIDVAISPLGLERFNSVPERIRHWARLLYSAFELVVNIRVTYGV
jgi:hypothetical protein